MGDLALHLFDACPADAHARAVIEQDFHRLRVIRDTPIHLGVHATGVVSEHPAERTAGMGSRVRPESQAVRVRTILQYVQHAARLHPRQPSDWVDFNHAMQILGPVHYDGRIAALPRQARATTPR